MRAFAGVSARLSTLAENEDGDEDDDDDDDEGCVVIDRTAGESLFCDEFGHSNPPMTEFDETCGRGVKSDSTAEGDGQATLVPFTESIHDDHVRELSQPGQLVHDLVSSGFSAASKFYVRLDVRSDRSPLLQLTDACVHALWHTQ